MARIKTRFGYKIAPVSYYIDEPFGFTTHAIDTVPVALACALNSSSWLECAYWCALCGGDTDTITAMAGGIAEALHGIPAYVAQEAVLHLDASMKSVVDQFYQVTDKTPPYLEKSNKIAVMDELNSLKCAYLKNVSKEKLHFEEQSLISKLWLRLKKTVLN